MVVVSINSQESRLPFASHEFDSEWMENQFFVSIVQHCLSRTIVKLIVR